MLAALKGRDGVIRENRPDKDGFMGRECPECEKYFKVKFGTGFLTLRIPIAYTGNHIGPHDEFWTKQQIEYAKSVALHKISGDLLKSLKKMERKPDRNSFISIGITRSTSIAYYSEKELEEKVACNSCTLESLSTPSMEPSATVLIAVSTTRSRS